MFAPPEPKVSSERILAATIVPLYSASASQKALWDLGQKKHHRALAAVTKSTDQTEPPTNCDASLHRAWERSKAFQEDLQLRHIAEENKKLVGSLAQIVSQPSSIAKAASQPRHKAPARGREAEKKRMKDVTRENELLVKRLLNVKPSLNRQADERDFARSRKDLERMKKITPPGMSRHAARSSRPELPASEQPSSLARQPEEDAQVGDFIAYDGSRRTLPPMPRNLSGSRSSPALTHPLGAASGSSHSSCTLPPVVQHGAVPAGSAAPPRLAEPQASSASRWRSESSTSAVNDRRPGDLLGSAPSTRNSFYPRSGSARTVECESSLENSSLGSREHSKMAASAPDTHASAQSLVAGQLPSATE